jgi:hypothetical protein
MDSMQLTQYTFLIGAHDSEEFEVISEVDAKAKFWEAKKCNYPTFEVIDNDGVSHVFVTEHVIMLSARALQE